MAYDVFLVSAREDSDVAKLIVRRLRALKFKVWHDAKYEDDTFDAKEARAAMDSQSMLVLWSANAVKSDWVRAAASVGHSRQGMLVQAALDSTVPYEPFRSDKRFPIEGMTSRKTPEGFLQLVEEIGRRDGRKDLREWMAFGAKDDDKRAAWLKAHPSDPMAREEQKKIEKAASIGTKAAGAAAASGAGAAALTSGTGGRSTSSPTPASPSERAARPGSGEDDEPIGRIGAYGQGASAPAASSAGASSAAPNTTYASSPRPSAATLTPPASLARSAAAAEESAGRGTLMAAAGAIALMFLAGWFVRAEPLPAVGNAQMEACPAGTIHERYIRPVAPLEHGPIIDDTK